MNQGDYIAWIKLFYRVKDKCENIKNNTEKNNIKLKLDKIYNYAYAGIPLYSTLYELDNLNIEIDKLIKN